MSFTNYSTSFGFTVGKTKLCRMMGGWNQGLRECQMGDVTAHNWIELTFGKGMTDIIIASETVPPPKVGRGGPAERPREGRPSGATRGIKSSLRQRNWTLRKRSVVAVTESPGRNPKEGSWVHQIMKRAPMKFAKEITPITLLRLAGRWGNPTRMMFRRIFATCPIFRKFVIGTTWQTVRQLHSCLLNVALVDYGIVTNTIKWDLMDK